MNSLVNVIAMHVPIIINFYVVILILIHSLIVISSRDSGSKKGKKKARLGVLRDNLSCLTTKLVVEAVDSPSCLAAEAADSQLNLSWLCKKSMLISKGAMDIRKLFTNF
ncbi:hypothetical protein L1887_27543 [Cichorium endivia]|nr:hypothetical protein L1887_27543 [Cichorium endivia]